MALILATGGCDETAALDKPVVEAAERQRLRRAAIFEQQEDARHPGTEARSNGSFGPFTMISECATPAKY
jgi:hypothetical protein